MDLSGRSGWERVNAGGSEWKPGGEGVKRVVSMLEGEEFGFLDIRVYTIYNTCAILQTDTTNV